jgi:hypothetical protein
MKYIKKLTPEQRIQNARDAAFRRWQNKKQKKKKYIYKNHPHKLTKDGEILMYQRDHEVLLMKTPPEKLIEWTFIDSFRTYRNV